MIDFKSQSQNEIRDSGQISEDEGVIEISKFRKHENKVSNFMDP